MSKLLKIFIVSGEASGDKLGGALMRDLNNITDNKIKYHGVGGKQMCSQGLSSLFDISSLSTMGLIEIIPRLPAIIRRIKSTVRAAIAMNPDVIITIDSPDFCFRVLAKIKKTLPHTPVIHYVAPSVWAWRPKRAYSMARYVDHVLALLPFEPPYMHKAGMSCDFVGHPCVFEPKVTSQQIKALKQDLKLNEGIIITLLLGSRPGEIKYMAPIFAKIADNLAAKYSNVQFIVPVANTVVPYVKMAINSWNVIPKLLLPQKNPYDSEIRKNTGFYISDIALATSGSVTLELAAQSCPMIMAYRANFLTTYWMKRLVAIDTVNLINILTNTRIIPEFYSKDCNVDKILIATLELLKQPQKQQILLNKAMDILGRNQKNMRYAAAQSVFKFIGKS